MAEFGHLVVFRPYGRNTAIWLKYNYLDELNINNYSSFAEYNFLSETIMAILLYFGKMAVFRPNGYNGFIHVDNYQNFAETMWLKRPYGCISSILPFVF